MILRPLYGVSRPGEKDLWEPIFNALQARRRNEKQRKRKRDSDCADAVIAETAILNDCVLLTDDQDLFAVMPTLGGQVMNP
jgi:predicted nucleic acid-binding protein